MSSAIITFERVWKKFRLGERHDSLRDLIPSLLRAVTTRKSPEQLAAQEFWALKDVSFSVARGEALGILGTNGAGKSTTLKLLTRILRPTTGQCAVRGRAGALIEVAAGFHPDLTGRENIYLQGSIMGMRRREIVARVDEIVDFSGVADFIDTPVKRYSSGMNARLGFSIAAHLQPAALIIDEVLAVGDMAFQQKCLARMQRFREEGVAIVFVSHNLAAIAQLCSSALLLHHGEVAAFGRPQEVLDAYVRSQDTRGTTGRGGATIDRTILVDGAAHAVSTARPGAPLVLRVECSVAVPLGDVTFGFAVVRSTDLLVAYEGTFLGSELAVSTMEGERRLNIDFTFRSHLTRGQYHLECYVLHNPTHEWLARVSPAAMLSIAEDRTRTGVADLEVEAVVVDSDREATTGVLPMSRLG